MTPITQYCRRRAGWRVLAAMLAIALLGVAGCTQISRMLGARPPKVTVTPPPASPSTAPPPAAALRVKPAPPLRTIVVGQLEHGHYAEGRRQLHRYIKQHPDDRAARDMWKQLTADPDKLLGPRSRIHVVKPGDTYSSLAARFLGDPEQFLILARYNHSPDPSFLQVGQKLRMPLQAHPQAAGSKPGKSRADQTAAASGAAGASPPSASKAEQLQQQSLVLLDQGHHRQAMDRMAQALDLDPKLKSPGGKADDLRQQLLASYHQRAIVLYRDQKLSQAIGLWDKILAIDPGYEPAIIYRARARELQSRLKQL